MVKRRLATCPSCNCRGEFVFLGDQRWPAELARAMGLPEVIPLWSCPSCLTTVSEMDLLPARVGVNCEPAAAEHTVQPSRK